MRHLRRSASSKDLVTRVFTLTTSPLTPVEISRLLSPGRSIDRANRVRTHHEQRPRVVSCCTSTIVYSFAGISSFFIRVETCHSRVLKHPSGFSFGLLFSPTDNNLIRTLGCARKSRRQARPTGYSPRPRELFTQVSIATHLRRLSSSPLTILSLILFTSLGNRAQFRKTAGLTCRA